MSAALIGTAVQIGSGIGQAIFGGAARRRARGRKDLTVSSTVKKK